MFRGLVIALGLASLAAASPPPGCDGAAFRQFDFWVGEWVVRNPEGTEVGRNRIERSLSGCVLHERWTSSRGPHRGESFNIYDAPRKTWHQTWVDNGGLLLVLEGGLHDGAMVLSGERPGKERGTVKHRITWTPREDGTVRQHWETSTDAGKTWATSFDGIYSQP